MKKYLMNVLIILMFLVGLSVLLYPAISEYVNEKHASRVVASYNQAVANTSEDKIAAMLADAHDYNDRLFHTSGAFFSPDRVSGYDQALDIIGTGVMGSISIDRIGVELPIYHGIDPTVLRIGTGHLPGTSLPVGGRGTHAVISGHRGLPSAKLFTNLDELQVGDTFQITVLRDCLTYRVDQIKTVKPDETDDLQIVPDKDYCTLLTCTPYGINTHRLLVRGERIESEYEKPGLYVANEAFLVDSLIVVPVASIPLLLILLVITLSAALRRRKNNRPAVGEKGEESKDET